MNDKLRKCTNCAKKYPREELIKHNGNSGGLFCETCNTKREKIDSYIIGICLVFIIIFLLYWLICKAADWWRKRNNQKTKILTK